MGQDRTFKKMDDLDFLVGTWGEIEIPTKQDKFKPVMDFELFTRDSDGQLKKVDDHKLYVKKDGPDSLRVFEERFRENIKRSLTDEHPYDKTIKLEVVVSVTMTEKRMKKVDVDNLTKAVLDCLKGLVFEDDSQIINVLSSKAVLVVGDIKHGLLVGVRKVNESQPSWFENISLFYLVDEDEQREKI
jgi:Holliday junction resolvase RusA-like endonuclease